MKRLSRLAALPLVFFYLCTPLLVFAQTQTTATPLPPTCVLSISPTVINVGGSIVLQWQSSNATGGSITGVGSVGPSGSVNLLPPSASHTTFVGTFNGPGGTVTCSATVQVNTSSGGGGTVTPTTAASAPASTPTPTTPTPVTQSPNGGLVPCGVSDNGLDSVNGSTNCQACNLAQLVQNIINFLIGLSIPIAAALFAYAGVLYFSSGANPGNIDKAKDIFKNALIGFLIAITGWLVINTLLHALLLNSATVPQNSWFTIQCDTGARVVNGTINTLLSTLPILSTGGSSNIVSNGGVGSSNPVYSCPTGYGIQSTSDGDGGTLVSCADNNGNYVDPTCAAGYTVNNEGACVNNSTNVIAAVTPSNPTAVSTTCLNGGTLVASESGNLCQNPDGSISNPVVTAPASDNSGACSSSAISASAAANNVSLSSQQASQLACFAGPESSCGTNLTGAATSGGVPSSAIGAFQVVVSTNASCVNNSVCSQAAQAANYNVPSGGLNCDTAVNKGAPAGKYASMSPTDPNNLGEACITAAMNFNCNVAAAACVINTQGVGAWTGNSDGLNHSAQQACTN